MMKVTISGPARTLVASFYEGFCEIQSILSVKLSQIDLFLRDDMFFKAAFMFHF